MTKRFLVANAIVGVFGIVLLALASQAYGSVTAPKTPWPTDGSSEYNLVPIPTGGAGQVDIMDHLYGAGNWKQISDQTQFYNPDGRATATAKYAGNSQKVSYVGASSGTTLLFGPITDNGLLSGYSTTLPTDAHENFILKDETASGTWYSTNQSLNTDDAVHAVVFQILTVPNEYVVAFEDESTAEGSDWDFNDVVIQLDDVQVVPEPATIAIWGVGIGLAGAAALRRKQPRGRWSQENRQAIYAIIGGKR